MQADAAATPGYAPGETPAMGATPTPKRGRSRWDETPAGPGLGATPAQVPGYGATPMMAAGATPMATPMGGMDMSTPTPSQLQAGQVTPEQYQVLLPNFFPLPDSRSPLATRSCIRAFVIEPHPCI